MTGREVAAGTLAQVPAAIATRHAPYALTGSAAVAIRGVSLQRPWGTEPATCVCAQTSHKHRSRSPRNPIHSLAASTHGIRSSYTDSGPVGLAHTKARGHHGSRSVLHH